MRDFIVCFQIITISSSRIVSTGYAVLTVGNVRDQLAEALDELKKQVRGEQFSSNHYEVVISSTCPA